MRNHSAELPALSICVTSPPASHGSVHTSESSVICDKSEPEMFFTMICERILSSPKIIDSPVFYTISPSPSNLVCLPRTYWKLHTGEGVKTARLCALLAGASGRADPRLPPDSGNRSGLPPFLFPFSNFCPEEAQAPSPAQRGCRP